MPALDLFPMHIWTQLSARRLRRASVQLLLACEPLGHSPLRQAIADYLNASRGTHCTAEQIAIVSGTQEALDLTARLLLNPGDRVAIEDPGYSGASIAFAAAGAKLAPISLDSEGFDLRDRSLRGAKLAYVTPGHQFPLGMTMSLPRRLALIEWARRTDALVFEDDYDSEFRYAGRPVPALQGLDRHGCVIFAGTFSKVLFPALRLAYVIVPPALVDRFAAVISVTTRHAPLLDQAILCDFISEGHYGRHLRRMREVYAERFSILMEESQRHLHGLLELDNIEAGLQTVGWLRKGLNAETVAQASAKHGIDVTPVSRYAQRPLAREGLQLGFAAVNPREIRRGIKELATAINTLL